MNLKSIKDADDNEIHVGDQLCGDDPLVSLVRVKEILHDNGVVLEWLHPAGSGISREPTILLHAFRNTAWRKYIDLNETQDYFLAE